MTLIKNFLAIIGLHSKVLFFISLFAWLFKVVKSRNVRVANLPRINLAGSIEIASNTRIGRDVVLNVGENGFLRIEEGVSIGNRTKITVPPNGTVSIGKYSRLNDNCMVVGRVTIGPNIVIASGVQLISNSHQLFKFNMSVDDADKTYGMIAKELKIGKGVFIGANAMLFGGCDIQEFCTISAGAVISNKVFPANQIIYSSSRNEMKRK
jgi:acetyltransferase-like isoleucine patch superfamily enzyme